MFCMEKPIVEIRALIRPIMSKEISVTVAMPTPVMMGSRLRYTSVGCFSPKKRRVRMTVNSGMVALTKRNQFNTKHSLLQINYSFINKSSRVSRCRTDSALLTC